MWTWLYKKDKANYELLTWNEWNINVWEKVKNILKSEELKTWVDNNSELFNMLFNYSFVRIPYYTDKEDDTQSLILIAWICKILTENKEKYINLKEFNSSSLISKFKDKLENELISSYEYENEGTNISESTMEDVNKNYLNNQSKLTNEDDWKNNKFLSDSTNANSQDKNNSNSNNKGTSTQKSTQTLGRQQDIKQMLDTLDKLKNADMWLLEVVSSEIFTNNIVKNRKDY